MAASSGPPERTCPYSEEPPAPAATAPKPPKSTLASERFIATHITWLRMIPEAPTSAPAMISMALSMTKPVAAAARPE